MKSPLFPALALGISMAILWSVVFVRLFGPAGIGVGICLGVSFAASGNLLARAKKKSDDEKKQDD